MEGLHDELHALTGSLARLQLLLPAQLLSGTEADGTACSAAAFQEFAAELCQIVQARPASLARDAKH